MKILGNVLWLIFGGLETAIGYFIGSVVLMCTIIGIPFGLQTLKLAGLAIWPFGSNIQAVPGQVGCLSTIMNLIWVVFAGIWIALTHILFGFLLALTIIGIPFAMQHFKMAGLALTPFGREIRPNF